MPWPYAVDAGIVKKWADKYGITINVTQINDYVESINQYTAGKFDGVTVTNMDALTIPAAGGVDTTAIIMGDYSNGNDGIVLKKGKTLADIKGQKINIVELSVSHYLLARGLSTVEADGKGHQDRQHVGRRHRRGVQGAGSDGGRDLESAAPGGEGRAGRHEVFDSSKIPGEIEDLMVVNTATLKDNPDLGKALVGIWYETIALMQDPGEKGKAAREAMAQAVRHRPRGLRGAAQDHPHVLHAARTRWLSPPAPSCRRSWTWSAPSPSSTICSAKHVKSKDAIGIEMPTARSARQRTSSCASTRPTCRWRPTGSCEPAPDLLAERDTQGAPHHAPR